MKVYTKIVINIETGQILEEESYEYDGMIAKCGGGTTVVAPPPPEPSETELAIQREILETMQRPKTESELLMEQYTIEAMKAQIEDLPMERKYKTLALEMMTRQLEELDSPEAQQRKALEAELVQWQMEGIQAAREMGAISGDLSEQEMTALDTMEQNAIQTLQTNIGRDSQKVMQSVVADMVDRGVLQGDVGAQAIAKVGERTQELLTEGIMGIETTRMGQQLGLQSEKASRELAWRNALMSGALTQQQFGQMKEQDISGQFLNQQALTQAAQQYSTGLSQEWDIAKMGAGIQQWGQMAGFRSATADRALQAAIATAESKASATASKWGAFGSAAGLGAAGWIMK